MHRPVYATEIALTNDVKTDVTSVCHDVICVVLCRHHDDQCSAAAAAAAAVNGDDNDNDDDDAAVTGTC